MDIRLDTRTIEPGGVLRGVIANAPDGGVGLAVRATVTTPFDEHAVETISSDFADGLFDLAGPTWPLTSDGPVIQTAWTVDVIDPSGSIAASVPFDLVAGDRAGEGAIAIEAVDNHDIDEPHHSIPPRIAATAGLVFGIAALGAMLSFVSGATTLGLVLAAVAAVACAALAAGYHFERRHVVEHDVHVRCEPADDRIDCTVRMQHPDLDLPEVTGIRATLFVVESARWMRPHGGHAEREEIVFRSDISLESAGPRTWTGTIDDLPLDDVPLSWAVRAEPEQWSVTWAVRFVVHTVGVADTVHVVHLRSRLRRLDPLVAGDGVGDPSVIHSS